MSRVLVAFRGLGLQVEGMMLNSMRLEPMFSSCGLQRCRGCLPPLASFLLNSEQMLREETEES